MVPNTPRFLKIDSSLSIHQILRLGLASATHNANEVVNSEFSKK